MDMSDEDKLLRFLDSNGVSSRYWSEGVRMLAPYARLWNHAWSLEVKHGKPIKLRIFLGSTGIIKENAKTYNYGS